MRRQPKVSRRHGGCVVGGDLRGLNFDAELACFHSKRSASVSEPKGRSLRVRSRRLRPLAYARLRAQLRLSTPACCWNCGEGAVTGASEQRACVIDY